MAPIFVIPRLFDFEMMLREDVVSAERMRFLEAYLKALGYVFPAVPPGQMLAPVSLRWRVASEIGIPRVPFTVWRRPLEKRGPHRSLPITIAVTTTALVEWGAQPLIELVFTATPAVGASLVVQALDDHLDPIVGEEVFVNARQLIRLHTPNMCALRVTGSGTVANFDLFPVADYANDDGWELIETVGLPFKLNETPGSVYDSRAQGFPWLPKAGIDAARDRLSVGLLMELPPHATAPDGLPVPAWPAPHLDELLFAMREAPDNPLQLVRAMLEQVDPSSFEKAQIAYRASISTDGFSQPGTGVSSEPGTAELAVSPLVLLSAGTENWTSLSLGFGTTTFASTAIPDPKVVTPNRLLVPAFDYMVTTTYYLPFGLKMEMAAVAFLARTLPVPPNGLVAETYHRHRPITRDGTYSEDVGLRWPRLPKQAPPQGYALAVRFGGGAPQVLNEKQTSTSFTPFLPAQRPDGDLAEEALVHYVDPLRVVPLAGSRTDTYLCATLDVFGRWSDWQVASHPLPASAPLRPQVLSAKFVLNVAAAAGRAVPAELDFELVWDWEDRSPQEIRLVGAFFDPATAPPTTAPSGLQVAPGGLVLPAVSISFSAAGVPALTAGSGSVTELAPAPDDGESRRYKVILTGYTADFTSASRLAYALYAQGSERVNPGVFSDFSLPCVARVNDPLPAIVPVIPPVIHWTALPDATGTARARLTFPAVPYAAGYVVYEASETALRDLAGLGAPSGDLITRATEVLGIAGTPAARDAFARVNRQIIPNPVAEVSLPGTVDSLYLYAVASVTSEQVESARSGPALVAVSRRITPGTPRLQARADAHGVHIRVEGVAGPPVAGAALFRTQSETLMVDLDLMGPPVFSADSPAWAVTDNVFTLVDVVPPGWRPYYYRAVAFGPDDAANGRLPGRSGPSGAIDVLIPPPDPPDLQPINQLVMAGGTLVRIQVRSLAETRMTPLGVHRIEFLTVNRSTPIPTEIAHAKADLNVISAIASPPVEAAGTVTRGPRDAAGRWLYESYVPPGDDEVIVRMTDPLGRITEQRTALTTAPILPDLTGFEGHITGNLLTVQVLSSAPITTPFFGVYRLELFNITGGGNTLLALGRLDTIGTTPTQGSFWRSGPNVDGRYTYSITLVIPPGSVHRVRVRLTDPSGQFRDVEGNV